MTFSPAADWQRNAQPRPFALGARVRYLDDMVAPAAEGVLMTFEAAAASPFPVLRHTWEGSYWEILDISAEAIDLSRVTNGVCPLLSNHSRWSVLESHLGLVDQARIEGAELIVSGRFDTGPMGADMARRVNGERTLRAVSIGYEPLEAVAEDQLVDGYPVVRITRWVLQEVSFVLVPADPTAFSRCE
ncbi:hypothetical protein PbB2_00088 [Candidatus Phycosocius bacilliformis]|uniref:Caudovirus prohead protease n=1 Tax=Candidatus Phycosocius bacilliformis TaxID=1445552 RepID=A0A2P2E5V6_9PROT|nr:hypothetical protein [Candidatus Phycosocius bacilliformis]GBF56432.1 hypothetical protein PbB2_00088 [Candidatus Phycosocius bacilliformis]